MAMQLVTITRVCADSDPSALLCYCTVDHGGGEIEENMSYAYRADDPYMGRFGRSVGEWLVDHEGDYEIEPFVPEPTP